MAEAMGKAPEETRGLENGNGWTPMKVPVILNNAHYSNSSLSDVDHDDSSAETFSCIPEPTFRVNGQAKLFTKTLADWDPIDSVFDSKNISKNGRQTYNNVKHGNSFEKIPGMLHRISNMVAHYRKHEKNLDMLLHLWNSMDPLIDYFDCTMDFHCHTDTLIQKGRDLLSGYFKYNHHEKKKEFTVMFSEMKLNEEYAKIQSHLDGLQDFDEELLEKIRSIVPCDRKPYIIPYGQAIQKLKVFQSNSLELKTACTENLQLMALWFENFGTHLTLQVSGNIGKSFEREAPNLEQVESMCNQMTTFSRKIQHLHGVSRSLISELGVRISKINSILEIRSHLGRQSNKLTRKVSNSKDEGITLLQFVSKSGHISPQFKRNICFDILEALKKLHHSKRSYNFLNPSTIVIQGNAQISLKDLENSSYQHCEPIPPWVFRAAECTLNNSHNENDKSLLGDIYSYGQVILWLASLEIDNFYGGSLIQLKESCPILNNSLNTEPTLRPSILLIEEHLKEVCDQLFPIQNNVRIMQRDHRPAKLSYNISDDQKSDSINAFSENKDGSWNDQDKDIKPDSVNSYVLEKPQEYISDNYQYNKKQLSEMNGCTPVTNSIDKSLGNNYLASQRSEQAKLAMDVHRKLEALFQDSDSSTVDLDYMQDELFDEDVQDELFSDGELSDPNSELAQRVQAKVKAALEHPEKLLLH